MSISFKNSRAMLVFTFLLKGGLYHITFRCSLLRVLVLVFGCSYILVVRQGVIVCRGCFVKGFFIAAQGIDSSVDGVG